MKIVAYCTLAAAQAVGKATSGTPLTSPPLVAADVTPDMLTADVLYFRLHGTESNTDVWFGDDDRGRKPIALRLKTVESLRLNGAVVIIANCYGSDSPFVRAFYDAGARTVIAAPGENYAGGKLVTGMDLLTRIVVMGLRRGWSTEKAANQARLWLRLMSWQRRRTRSGKIVYPNRDASKFEIVGRKESPTENQEV